MERSGAKIYVTHFYPLAIVKAHFSMVDDDVVRSWVVRLDGSKDTFAIGKSESNAWFNAKRRIVENKMNNYNLENGVV